MKAAIGVLFMICALGACGPGMRDDDDGAGDDGAGDDGGGSGSGVPRQCNQMDIVFVVDDSGSMMEEQSNLGSNFPMFASLLSNYTTSDGQKIDFRVAVTTTGKDLMYTINAGGGLTLPMSEAGDNGAFKNNCNSSKRWLEPNDASLGQTLACRANVGTDGPGFEMPLLMSKWALGKRVADGTNAGFIRPDALLAIVMLTDEDDGSTEQNNFVVTPTSQPPVDYNPADHIAFLDQLKGHRSRWAAGVIAGDGDCSSSFGNAVNATRLKDFVSRANSSGSTQAVFSSICDGDLTIGLKKALDTFQAACGGIIL
jgi:hypothetical protein